MTHPPMPAIRVMMMPKDTNALGSIFGGVILSHIDLAGAQEAAKAGLHKYVTVAMDQVVFKEPVFVGDTVSFYTSTEKIGRTSISVRVKVRAVRRMKPLDEEVDVTEALVTFVAVDDDRRPIPIKKG
ncbi:MAG: acyl-CoA thioesterase [Planctomycetota bacterium]